MPTDRLTSAIAAIDRLHAQDPATILLDGVSQPAELVYARRMTDWLLRLEPTASEALQLAVRAQHLQRWQIPRESYPADRIGYLQWRTDLKNRHAAQLGEVLAAEGYDAAIVRQAQSVVKKEQLKHNPDSQLLEDAACLVFLEFEFADFAARHDREKIINILQKTWQKMSPAAQGAALALPLSDYCRELVGAALTRREPH
ncbi:MAG: DUF4202 domain-containing protein [Pirellulales bacterium]|nr:DUF4202 domain-containing protein [Pirellulales bacterium]